jgi:hypothetical protein
MTIPITAYFKLQIANIQLQIRIFPTRIPA